MTYTATPDRRMPYDNDGTVMVASANGHDYTDGASLYPTGTQLLAMNSYACLVMASGLGSSNGGFGYWWFFPEQREITGLFVGYSWSGGGSGGWTTAPVVQGSNDTTNGLDGTWETAAIGGTLWPTAAGGSATSVDAWRSAIHSVSFTGPKKVLRMHGASWGIGGISVSVIHIYGQKGAGQTPDDILFLDGLASYAEFAAVEDFGDVPLATSTTRTFKVKNGSATKTANTINIQCNDADFVISTDNVTWVVTINIASLAAGASSGVMYVRNTSPAIGSPLGPRFARVVATVASYT